MAGMLLNSNLVVSAWNSNNLVGIARCITDFHHACYLSDLAFEQKYQKCGIAKQLQILTQNQLGEHCKLILIVAPAANEYCEKIGFTNNPRACLLNRGSNIGS